MAYGASDKYVPGVIDQRNLAKTTDTKRGIPGQKTFSPSAGFDFLPSGPTSGVNPVVEKMIAHATPAWLTDPGLGAKVIQNQIRAARARALAMQEKQRGK